MEKKFKILKALHKTEFSLSHPTPLLRTEFSKLARINEKTYTTALNVSWCFTDKQHSE